MTQTTADATSDIAEPESGDPSRSAFAQELARLRNKVGISQGELARRTGISYATISRLESGTRVPTLDHVTAIAKVLKNGVPATTRLSKLAVLASEARQQR